MHGPDSGASPLLRTPLTAWASDDQLQQHQRQPQREDQRATPSVQLVREKLQDLVDEREHANGTVLCVAVVEEHVAK